MKNTCERGGMNVEKVAVKNTCERGEERDECGIGGCEEYM